MSETARAVEKRKSINRTSGFTMMKKSSAPSTPQQTKSTFKMQSEQKQIAKENKNKRKSLPANIANGDSNTSPKKPKIEPFSGTSDLLLQMKKEPQVKNENVKAKKESPQNKDSEKDANSGSRAKRRREKLKAQREASKQKLKQTYTDAAGGNEAALAFLKERASELQNKDALSLSARRKLKKLRKILKDAGVMLPDVKPNLNKASSKKVENVNQKGKKIKAEGGNNLNQKSAIQQKKDKKQGKNKPQIKKEVEIEKEEPESEEEEEDDSEDGEEEEEGNDNSFVKAESMEDEGEEEEDSDEAGEDEEEDDSDDDEEEGDDSVDEDQSSEEDEDEKEVPQQRKLGKQPQIKKPENKGNNVSSPEQSKSRYVLFVGNLPFDITKEEISQHFAKIGNVKDIRIPLDRQTNKCRGFAYVELLNQTDYEKALSLHHTSIKGRRINVLYSQGGKKKGDEKKQEIKAKNFKLQAMRQQGKLAGSVKQSQNRTARRDKKHKAQKAN